MLWMLYFNGTGVEMPFRNSRDEVIKIAEKTIVTGLQSGVSLDTQKQYIMHDLKEMEQYLVDTFPDAFSGEDLKAKLGKDAYHKFCKKWAINVISGLKLKLFENNDQNGHLYIAF